jgi:hypothetical protein
MASESEDSVVPEAVQELLEQLVAGAKRREKRRA